jgi:phospholipid transport system substrate-binding protein
LAAVVLAVMLAAVGTAAHADNRAGAIEVVEHFQNGLLYTLLHQRDMDYDTRIQALEALIAETFDVERVARKVIGGDRFHELSRSEQQRYQTLFTRYVVATQSRRLGSLKGRDFVPLGRRYGPNGTVVVDVSFREQGREITTVAYILLPTGKGWRIVDVIIDGGVSELTLRRSEFSSVVRAKGVDGLMSALDEKIGELARAGSRRTY